MITLMLTPACTVPRLNKRRRSHPPVLALFVTRLVQPERAHLASAAGGYYVRFPKHGAS